jgi:hypothetical protein
MPLSRLVLALVLGFASAQAAEQKGRDVSLQSPQALPGSLSLTPLSPSPGLLLPASPPSGVEVLPPSLPAASLNAEAGTPQTLAPLSPAAGAEKDASAGGATAPSGAEGLVEDGRRRFDLTPENLAAFEPSAAELAKTQYSGVPAEYRDGLAQRGAPKVELDAVLSRHGSSAIVFEGRLRGQAIAVKTYKTPPPGRWPRSLEFFGRDARNAQIMSRVLGPKGLAPKSFGEVDIGEGGNPSLGLEKITGIDVQRMTPRQARALIGRSTILQAAEGVKLLAAAGLGGTDSPQAMVLTRAQTINGVPRKAGDVVFMDAAGLGVDREKWRTPEDEAAEMFFMRLLADQMAPFHPDEVIDDIPITPADKDLLREKARRYAKALLASPSPAPAAPKTDALKSFEVAAAARGAKADAEIFKKLAAEIVESLKSAKSLKDTGADISAIAKAQRDYKARLAAGVKAVLAARGLRDDAVLSHGTNIEGFLGMLFTGDIRATTRYQGFSGESAEVWGGRGTDVGVAYGATKGTHSGQPGVVVILAGAGLQVVRGDALNRTPTVENDFVGAVITDGERTVVLDKAALQALGASSKAWKELAVSEARRGRMAEFSRWEAVDRRIVPQ